MSTDFALSSDVERLLLHSCSQGLPMSSQEKALDYKLLVDPPLPSATITDLCNEPLFLNAYLSDEEDCSASEADDMSFTTGTSSSVLDDDFSVDIEATLPELLAEECTSMEQQCGRAQAVMLVSAGRPKMIQVAKINSRSSPALSRASSSSSSMGRIVQREVTVRSSTRLLHANDQYSPSISTTSSYANFSMPRTPEFPSTPSLQDGLLTPTWARTPVTPNTPSSRFGFDPLPSPTGSDHSSKPTSNSRRSNQSDMINRSKSTYTSSPPIYSYKPKGIVRASSERLPYMDLPPFPGNPATKAKSSRSWASLKMDSFGPGVATRSSRMKKVES